MRTFRLGALTTLALVLTGAVRAAGPLPEVGVLGDQSRVGGFAQVLGPRVFTFPADHGPHPDYRQEWWYVTGNLDGANGERFGFELTFFRFALAPAGGGSASASAEAGAPGGSASAGSAGPAALRMDGATPESAWRTRQIYMAHFAITDVARGRFRFSQKLSRGAAGLAGAQVTPLRVWIDDWSLAAASAQGESPWKLHAAEDGYELSLDARPLLQPVLNGDRGFSRKSSDPGSASYYYSIPRMAVRGTLTRDGQSVDVNGLAWLDREWGSGALSRREQGWDWFALQLENGSSFMFYSLREQGGGRDVNSAGTWVDATGQVRALSSDQVRIDVLDHWTNRRGERYPARWRVRVPSVGMDVSVRPVLADQELTTSAHYWEGAVDVAGAGANHAMDGRGYVELVGYAAQ